MKRTLVWCLAAMLCALGAASPPAAWAQASKDKPAKSAKATSKDTDAKKPAGPVDINNASTDELEAVKGIGPATAKKIIAGRPYKSPDELVAKKAMSQKAYDKVKDQLVAGASTAAPAPAVEKPAARAEPKSAAPSAAAPPAARSGASAKASSEPAQTPPEKGMVWVNTDSKVYHREGDRWYGKTKAGKFMTEAEALKEGYRAAKQ